MVSHSRFLSAISEHKDPVPPTMFNTDSNPATRRGTTVFPLCGLRCWHAMCEGESAFFRDANPRRRPMLR